MGRIGTGRGATAGERRAGSATFARFGQIPSGSPVAALGARPAGRCGARQAFGAAAPAHCGRMPPDAAATAGGAFRANAPRHGSAAPARFGQIPRTRQPLRRVSDKSPGRGSRSGAFRTNAPDEAAALARFGQTPPGAAATAGGAFGRMLRRRARARGVALGCGGHSALCPFRTKGAGSASGGRERERAAPMARRRGAVARAAWGATGTAFRPAGRREHSERAPGRGFRAERIEAAWRMADAPAKHENIL